MIVLKSIMLYQFYKCLAFIYFKKKGGKIIIQPIYKYILHAIFVQNVIKENKKECILS